MKVSRIEQNTGILPLRLRSGSEWQKFLLERKYSMGHSLFDLSGKTAVVVGGTSGIGLAMAVGLAEAGADVVASSRRQEQVDEAAGQIEGKGRKALRLTSDVGDRATLERLLAETVKAWGKVDILINCAGKIKRAPTVDFPEDVWDDIMDTNVTGTLRACQVFMMSSHTSSGKSTV